MKRPPVHYVRTDDGVHIAYQLFGDGPLDVLFVGSWVGQIDIRWEWPGYARWFERLASFARVVVFDKRGVGASDAAPPHSITLEDWVDDARAVMDAVGFDRAAVVTWTDATAVGLALSATFPERVAALAIVNWSLDIFQRTIQRGMPFPEWGTDAMLERLATLAPGDASNPAYQDWFLRMQRASGAPAAIEAMYTMLSTIDVGAIIPLVSTPTLVVRRADLPSSKEAARQVVSGLRNARSVEVPGDSIHTWAGEVDPLIDEVEAFFTGVRPARHSDRVLLTVLFSDIVGSTDAATRMGDAAWRDVLDRHDSAVRRAIADHRGREILTKGDEFLVTFDGPARAVRAAQAIHAAASRLGLEMRTGIHTGEVELRGDDVAGIAVHIGARVREQAAPGQIVVSRTVKDLVAGSGLEFADAGVHTLKGVPDAWHLYSVIE